MGKAPLFFGAIPMKFNPIAFLRTLRRNAAGKTPQTRMQANSTELEDLDADEFFAVIGGEAVTFGEFNKRMELHFGANSEQTDHQINRSEARVAE